MKKYQIIYADPPWSYNDKLGDRKDLGSATSAYPTQSLEWIKNLQVKNITDKNCVLFLWAVSPLLPEALEVITAWGFKYKTLAFCWSKTTSNLKEVANMGRWTMGNVELCLLATKGSPKRVSRTIRQLVSAERTRHSAKPTIVRELIVELMGDLPRLEIFSRPNNQIDIYGKNTFDGWNVWGNEVDSNIEL